ncbi:MAG: succinate dehydrogenase [Casimicrobiaceae bacterium]
MTTAATQARLWYAQRASAMVLGVCVVIHLAVIVYATQQGLSGGAILARTRGSAGFAAFYAVFVAACAIHAPIGLRVVAQEWLRWRGPWLDATCGLFGLVVLLTGLRAVWALAAS